MLPGNWYGSSRHTPDEGICRGRRADAACLMGMIGKECRESCVNLTMDIPTLRMGMLIRGSKGSAIHCLLACQDLINLP